MTRKSASKYHCKNQLSTYLYLYTYLHEYFPNRHGKTKTQCPPTNASPKYQVTRSPAKLRDNLERWMTHDLSLPDACLSTYVVTCVMPLLAKMSWSPDEWIGSEDLCPFVRQVIFDAARLYITYVPTQVFIWKDEIREALVQFFAKSHIIKYLPMYLGTYKLHL